MANKADNKTIKELEKKLKIKKRKKRKNKKRNDDEDEDEEDEENDEIFRLPNDFKQDNLACLSIILSYSFNNFVYVLIFYEFFRSAELQR